MFYFVKEKLETERAILNLGIYYHNLALTWRNGKPVNNNNVSGILLECLGKIACRDNNSGDTNIVQTKQMHGTKRVVD